MGRNLYVTSYLAIATNTSAIDLANALAAIPRDSVGESNFGLQNLADVTTIFLNQYARRSLSYELLAPPPVTVATDATAGSFLENYYTARFSQALSTKVVFEGVATLPAPLPGPLVWVNAQYSASGGSVPIAFDLSGHGDDLVQAAPANRPTMNPNGFAANVATLSFDGASSFLQSLAALAYDECTYFVSFKSPNLAAPGMLVERSVNAAANPGERMFQNSAPTHAILARRAGVTHFADTAPGNWGVDGAWHVAAFVYSRTTGGALIVDGVSRATFAPLAAQAVVDTLFVGAESGPALLFTGDIREIFVYPAALAPADIDAISRYMGPQVGIVI